MGQVERADRTRAFMKKMVYVIFLMARWHFLEGNGVREASYSKGGKRCSAKHSSR
jgi:hypothetical protein